MTASTLRPVPAPFAGIREHDLRRALRDEQCRLACQVQVDPRDRAIVPIGRWVLETACRPLAAWLGHPATRGLRPAVNVSARPLAEPDFVDGVERVLADVDGCAAKMRALRAIGAIGAAA
jgi:EAL domain-containing protein (putative c-di-GMP-specific phosphodiesterase class I)